jgi:hypothetical protein
MENPNCPLLVDEERLEKYSFVKFQFSLKDKVVMYLSEGPNRSCTALLTN